MHLLKEKTTEWRNNKQVKLKISARKFSYASYISSVKLDDAFRLINSHANLASADSLYFFEIMTLHEQ